MNIRTLPKPIVFAVATILVLSVLGPLVSAYISALKSAIEWDLAERANSHLTERGRAIPQKCKS